MAVRSSLRPLDFRKAAARDLAAHVELHRRLDDLQAELRLGRERCARLHLADPELAVALEHLDQAVIALGTIKRRVEGE